MHPLVGPIDGVIDTEHKNKCVSKNDPRAAQIRDKMAKDAHEELKKHPRRFVERIRKVDPSFIISDDELKSLGQTIELFRERRPDLYTLTIYPPNLYCRIKQPTNLALSLPLNPTWESNVLKNPANNSPGYSLGFGGTATLTTAGVEGRPFDLAALSIASASARYPNFLSKSLDSITEQAAYQIFLGGLYYPSPGGKERVFTGKEGDKDLPAGNLITFDTLSVGFQNQTAFLPGVRSETADLFTPQVTFARSNTSLLGGASSNVCLNSSKKLDAAGFCYYLDWSLTAGQTLSDVSTQQNTNLAGSVTPGWRIRDTDWKLTLPTVVTSRFYNDVVGSRRDVLFQIGPALSYSKPAMAGEPYVSFSVAVTYNQNCSTLAAASWRGVIIQPTLTIAFIPLSPPK